MQTSLSLDLRREALLLLKNEGTILDTAREISRLMRDADVQGAVVGGVAVVLHGFIRTTSDVNVLVQTPLEEFAPVLTRAGYALNRRKKEFSKGGCPVHLVLPEQISRRPCKFVELDGVTTVSLADLINMKLRSGTTNMLRAQDLADVIGLIRKRRLTSAFAMKLEKSLQSDFRKLVQGIRKESR